MSTFETNNEIIDIEDSSNTDINVEEGNKDINNYDGNVGSDIQQTTIFNSILDKSNSQVTYSDVLEIATDLCRTVSDDPLKCKSTYGIIFEWITKLREGEDFDISFNNKGLPSDETMRNKQPLAAVITPKLKRRKRQKRYKSSKELSQMYCTRNNMNTICDKSDSSQSSNDISFSKDTNYKPYTSKSKKRNMDEDFVLKGNSDRRYCFLCRKPQCTRWTCSILKGYEKVPGRLLVKGNQEVRDNLISLIATLDNHVLCFNRSRDDQRVIFNELPRKVKAIIVYKKYIMEKNVSQMSQNDNICIECTLLGDHGEVIENYSKALFKKICIIRYVGKGTNNLVVDNLS